MPKQLSLLDDMFDIGHLSCFLQAREAEYKTKCLHLHLTRKHNWYYLQNMQKLVLPFLSCQNILFPLTFNGLPVSSQKN